jgi:NAD-dependent dihydropyrimidine dehydrogenase PreA subunit
MKRKIIQIDDEKCNGCGLCIPNCQEGALQMIDDKARLISDLFCDGLGACIGHCPEGAIEIIEREAEPYDERKVMEMIVPKGRNTILAHLEHLRDHGETEFLNQAILYLKENNIDMSPETSNQTGSPAAHTSLQHAIREEKPHNGCGCPGAQTMDFSIAENQVTAAAAILAEPGSELRQWPVQLHLLNPQASYFKNADVVLAADCAAFAMGNFHARFMKGKSLAIACPKLDSNKESYVEKLTSMIADARINSLNVIMMEVPCCGGLLQMAQMARQKSGRNIPVKQTIIGIKGDILQEDWA